VSGAGRDDVNAMLIGALGCGIAWAIIDAIMYLMGCVGERALAQHTVVGVQAAASPAAARAIIAGALPPEVGPILTDAELERIRAHLVGLSAENRQVRLAREDWLGGLVVFLLVFLGTFPVVLPFLLFSDMAEAQRWSHAVAVVLLFLTGYAFGRQTGRPWLLGAAMVAIGLILVAIAVALGG
jgi:VIT1/CCC1 family predicted Fe2+/Mn2+ transporter